MYELCMGIAWDSVINGRMLFMITNWGIGVWSVWVLDGGAFGNGS